MNAQIKSLELSAIEVCYCDDEAAWRLALAKGLPQSARIRTTNPNLLMHPPAGATVEPIEGAWSPAKIEGISAAVETLVKDVRASLLGSAYERYTDLVVRDAFVWTYLMPWAITLGAADLTEPRGIVSVDYGNFGRHSNGHARWAELLAANPRLVRLTFERADCGIGYPNPSQSPTRRQLLKYYPFSHLEYTVWRAVWKVLPHAWSRGTMYVGIDNPAIRETLVEFGRRGYAVHESDRPPAFSGRQPIPEGLRALMTPVLRRYLAPWIDGPVADALVDMFFRDMEETLAGFEAADAYWTKAIARWKPDKPVAFLSNIVLPTEVLPLPRRLREAGIPLVLFQHGHSRELTQYLKFNRCISEETFADVFVCYDDKASEFVGASEHRKAEVITSGVPDIYHLSQHHIADNELGDIGYIQTGIPMSSRAAPFTMTWTDLQKEQFETELYERCFARLPYTVTVKPYLAPDYSGQRRSHQVVDRSANINIYSKGFDLRYIAGNFRVLVTSRATSTLGWCLLAGRPLVYLDLPYQYPLWDDARAALRESIFYFDMTEPDAIDRLTALLSQPMAEIDRQWAEKADARKRFLARFVDSGSRAFGRNTYRGIKNYLAAPKRG